MTSTVADGVRTLVRAIAVAIAQMIGGCAVTLGAVAMALALYAG